MFASRPEVQQQTGYSMMWTLDNEAEMSYYFSQDGVFSVETKFVVNDDVLMGKSVSECGVRSSITLVKE